MGHQIFRNRRDLGTQSQLSNLLCPSWRRFIPKSISISGANLLNGLIAYYKLDGDGNDSVNSYHGTSGYAASSNGKINQGLACGGSNYLALPDIPFSAQMSIGVWAYANSWDTYSGVFQLTYGDSSNKSFRITKDGSQFGVNCTQYDGTNKAAVMASVPSTGAWHYYLAEADGSTLKLYIDNVEVASVACGDLKTTYSGTNWAGIGWAKVWSGATNIYFNGIIDEAAVWNRALTGEERTLAYKGGLGFQYPFVGTTYFYNMVAQPPTNQMDFTNNSTYFNGQWYCNPTDKSGTLKTNFSLGTFTQISVKAKITNCADIWWNVEAIQFLDSSNATVMDLRSESGASGSNNGGYFRATSGSGWVQQAISNNWGTYYLEMIATASSTSFKIYNSSGTLLYTLAGTYTTGKSFASIAKVAAFIYSSSAGGAYMDDLTITII